MDQQTVTLVVAGLGIGGALGGIVTGHFLTKNSQHDQWLRDCRKEEFKGLLATLTKSWLYISTFDELSGATPEERFGVLTARSDVILAIGVLVYIDKDMSGLDVSNEWKNAVKTLEENHSIEEFKQRYNDIRNAIVKVASRDF
jgi:hypothetical protein